jgi:3-deoxy-7-phosphoheptulonate synthase
MGAMIESHLHGGSQRMGEGAAGLAYGLSITDACIDWETTEALLREADATLRAAAEPRRATGS